MIAILTQNSSELFVYEIFTEMSQMISLFPNLIIINTNTKLTTNKWSHRLLPLLIWLYFYFNTGSSMEKSFKRSDATLY
jgi:hypothetical protein